MRILILGGSGFIGSHLVDRLAPHHTLVVTGRRQCYPWGELGLQHRYIPLDMAAAPAENRARLSALIDGCDLVVHAASSTVPASANANPRLDIEQNLLPVIDILEVLREHPGKRLVYLSSGGTVYGAPGLLPVPETAPLLPLGAYGMVKVSSENYIRMYHRLYDIPFQIFRVSNPYGPRQDKAGIFGLVSTALQNLYHDRPVNIWGDGSVRRDYIWIGDLTNLLEKAIESPVNGTFNAGSGIAVSVNDVLDLAGQVSGKTLQRNYLPSRGYDVPAIALDISVATRQFGWKPEVSLEQGMQTLWRRLNTGG